MHLKRCPSCGVPKRIASLIRWNSNGTITQFFNPEFRVVILPSGFIRDIFNNISTRLGISVDHIAREAQKNASRAVFDTIFDRMPGARIAFRFDFMKHLQVKSFHQVGMLCGHCRSDTVEYIPGVRGIGRIRNPFDLDLVGANVAGAFEALEQIPYEFTWEKESENTYLICVEPSGSAGDLSERLKIDMPATKPGMVEHDRCTKCRVPRWISDFIWNEDEGTITGRRFGGRVVLLDGYMLLTVFRELAKELGEDAEEIVIGAQRAWMLSHFGEVGLTKNLRSLEGRELERALLEALGILPVLGHGNPTLVRVKEGKLQIHIHNPYEKYILGGTAAALYEIAFGRSGKVVISEPSAAIVFYEVFPK